MRSRVAVATAVSRGFRVFVGVVVLVGVQVVAGQGAGVADAATTDVRAAAVLRDGIDFGLTGAVGMIAVLAGAVGLVVGLTRRRRQSVARRAALRATTPQQAHSAAPAVSGRRSA